MAGASVLGGICDVHITAYEGIIYLSAIAPSGTKTSWIMGDSRFTSRIDTGTFDLATHPEFTDVFMMGIGASYAEINTGVYSLVPNHVYHIIVQYKDTFGQDNWCLYSFVYRELLGKNYIDVLEFSTITDVAKATNSINSHVTDEHTTTRTNVIDKIETSYIGNMQLEAYYCTEVPTPNPRNLTVGCEDYTVTKVKNTDDADWSSPIYTSTNYYWYNTDGKIIKFTGDDE